ncbi:hypothetical protein GCM10009612_69250 [Streptomyces beijiangensis]
MDAWLRKHAPKTYATLRPPADPAAIAALAQELDVELPDDLVASLRRHDGAVKGAFRFAFAGGDGPMGVEEILHRGQMFQELWDEEDDAELLDGYYWHARFVMFADSVTADGLAVDCRPGDTFGAVGDFFNGEGTRFGDQPSIAAMLHELAGVLEQGLSMGSPLAYAPVAFDGELIWEHVQQPLPAPRSVLEQAAEATEAALPEPDHGRFTPRAEDGWAGEYGSFCLTFVHGVDASELLDRFGALARTRADRTRGVANEESRSWTSGYLPTVRAGRTGEWAFGIEEGRWEGSRGEVLRRLSRGTRAVSLFFSGFTKLSFYENGELVTVYDTRRSHRPAGEADPHQIFPGLPDSGALGERDVMRAVCSVLTSELGIDLLPDALRGELTSAQLLPVLPEPALREPGRPHGPDTRPCTAGPSPFGAGDADGPPRRGNRPRRLPGGGRRTGGSPAGRGHGPRRRHASRAAAAHRRR